VRSFLIPLGKIVAGLVIPREMPVVQSCRPERGVEEAEHACCQRLAEIIPPLTVEKSEPDDGSHDDVRVGQDGSHESFLAAVPFLSHEKPAPCGVRLW
jgi:hypothetical protein